MRLKKVEIIKYRNFENVVIDFENSKFPDVFSIASKNGGGKSTLLQFIFVMLRCFSGHTNIKNHLSNLLKRNIQYIQHIQNIQHIKENKVINFVKFIIEVDNKVHYLNFYILDDTIYFDTTMSKYQLNDLSVNIFLAVPNSQRLFFVTREENKSDNIKDNIANFSTYSFATEEAIIRAFDVTKEQDFIEVRKYDRYGTNYIDFKETLKECIDDKEIRENEDGTKILFKLKGNNEEILLEDLSHGESRKLGIYIWIKSIVKKDSIVLMDEPDIALHPKWQYELLDDLVKWSKGSQFILATHSPQILSSTYYKNLILLDKQENKTIVKQLNQAPLDRDINIMLSSIMGTHYIPKHLEELHLRYRNLFEDGKIDSKEAEELKLEILEYESENSSFFQGIAFDRELQDI